MERRVCEQVAQREGELVELLRVLVGFDTVTHTAGAAPRDEAALQRFLGERLAARGAEVRVVEPEPTLVAGHPTIPEGFTFAGRPQLVARFPGAGEGRTLLLNGTSTWSTSSRARRGRSTLSTPSSATARSGGAARAT